MSVSYGAACSPEICIDKDFRFTSFALLSSNATLSVGRSSYAGKRPDFLQFFWNTWVHPVLINFLWLENQNSTSISQNMLLPVRVFLALTGREYEIFIWSLSPSYDINM